MPDKIKITILEDGTIKLEADKISQANHVSAEAFMREIKKLAGGPVTITKAAHAEHGHSHSHGQDAHQH